MKVLLIEDNLQISKNIIRYLALQNIACDSSLDGKDGFHKAVSNYYDVIILDINLPLMNGLEVLKSIRDRQKDSQILMLTSNALKEDVVLWLNMWADDYMTKPFDFEELLARLHTLNRRNLKNKSNIISFWKGYTMDIEKTEVKKDGEWIKFSNLEFNLLKYLIQNKEKTISRQELYEKVWGEFDGDIMFSKTVDVYIGYLRKKIHPDIIQTIKGVGYKINE